MEPGTSLVLCAEGETAITIGGPELGEVGGGGEAGVEAEQPAGQGEPQQALEVVQSDAVVEPEAVVVLAGNTGATHAAVAGSGRPVLPALLAVAGRLPRHQPVRYRHHRLD